MGQCSVGIYFLVDLLWAIALFGEQRVLEDGPGVVAWAAEWGHFHWKWWVWHHSALVFDFGKIRREWKVPVGCAEKSFLTSCQTVDSSFAGITGCLCLCHVSPTRQMLALCRRVGIVFMERRKAGIEFRHLCDCAAACIRSRFLLLCAAVAAGSFHAELFSSGFPIAVQTLSDARSRPKSSSFFPLLVLAPSAKMKLE